MRFLNMLVALLWVAQSAFFVWGLLKFGESIGGLQFFAHVRGTLISGALVFCAVASAVFAVALFVKRPPALLLIVVAGVPVYFLSGILLRIPILLLLMPPGIMVVREVVWPFLSAVAISLVSVPFVKLSASSKVHEGT